MIPTPGLWYKWFRANFLAFALSYALLAIVDQAVDAFGAHGNALGFVAHVISMLLGGILIGVLQIHALGAHFKKAIWIAISAIVYPLSFIIGEVLGGLPYGLLTSFVLFGILSGIWQSLFLRRQTLRANWWILISTLGFALAGLIATAIILTAFALGGRAILDTLSPIPAFTIIGAVGGGVAGTITGFGLAKLLQ